jgi:hypothetical protein
MVNDKTSVKILFLSEKQKRFFVFCGKIKKALADIKSVTPY